jgi:protein-L-isoaspartate(D-aspartate) O-methyltransferase
LRPAVGVRTFHRVPELLRQRERLAANIESNLGPFDPMHLQAIRVVARERFVREMDVSRSAEDMPLPLDDAGLATVSAPHAYLLSFRLLGLAPGDHFVELGSGTGYGAALASFIVGPRGHVTTVEIDPDLAARTKVLLADLPNVVAVYGDAIVSTALWRDAPKVACTFAIAEIPHAWLHALPDRGIVVAPVGTGNAQELVRAQREGDSFHVTKHGGVRYVGNRSTSTTT